MDTILPNGYDEETLEALHTLAEKLPLGIILAELGHIYRAAGDHPTGPECRQIGAAWLRSLDASLRRREAKGAPSP